MNLIGNVYAFDECSILHMCRLNIKAAYRIFFGKDFIAHKNFNQLSTLLKHLRDKNKTRAKFIPAENFDRNLLRSYDELLSKQGAVQMLKEPFKKEMLDQLEEFYEDLNSEFIDIQKNDNIRSIKTFFIANERQLKKQPKIPEDDDLKIISAYCQQACTGQKYLISEDEHFWGYDDLIEAEYGFTVVKEWECHKLAK